MTSTVPPQNIKLAPRSRYVHLTAGLPYPRSVLLISFIHRVNTAISRTSGVDIGPRTGMGSKAALSKKMKAKN